MTMDLRATRTFKPALKAPLRAILDLSTAHMTRETLELLNGCDAATDLQWSCYPTEYGWLVYAHDDCWDELGVPPEIAVVMRKARELGADYILFDCDADEFPEILPVFEH